MPEPTDLGRDLTELGRTLPAPGAARMDEVVLARLARAERSAPSSTRFRIRAMAVGLAIVVALLATPPVRAAVADWFGFGSVVVREGDGDSSRAATPTVPTGSPLSLEAAAARVDFAVYELPRLGAPDGAWVSSSRRVLTFAWDAGIRLDQSSSRFSTLEKIAPSWRHVSVDGRDALWFGGSHDVVGLDESGPRQAGPTLLWRVGETTLRLEGDLSLERALALAETAHRHS